MLKMMFPRMKTQSATATPCSGPNSVSQEGMYPVGIVPIRLKLSGEVVGKVR